MGYFWVQLDIIIVATVRDLWVQWDICGYFVCAVVYLWVKYDFSRNNICPLIYLYVLFSVKGFKEKDMLTKKIFKFFFTFFFLNKMRRDMIHIPDIFKIRKKLRQHKLLSEVSKGDSNLLKQICNLCNVQVLNLKQHFKSKKHIKNQNELIKLRRDSMYCKEWNLHFKYHKQHTLSKNHDFIQKYKFRYNGI